MQIFTPISDEDKKLNIPSGLLSYSDGHYIDLSQTNTNNTPPHSGSIISILSPSGLQYQDINKNFVDSSVFSNSKRSRDLSINDFNIFNEYIHYIPRYIDKLPVIQDDPMILAVKIN